jgi:hypothetical protein
MAGAQRHVREKMPPRRENCAALRSAMIRVEGPGLARGCAVCRQPYGDGDGAIFHLIPVMYAPVATTLGQSAVVATIVAGNDAPSAVLTAALCGLHCAGRTTGICRPRA